MREIRLVVISEFLITVSRPQNTSFPWTFYSSISAQWTIYSVLLSLLTAELMLAIRVLCLCHIRIMDN